VGSADSEEHDQVLDSVLLGPIGPGQYKFVLQVSRHRLNPVSFEGVHLQVAAVFV
jgi:hypothetical protein